MTDARDSRPVVVGVDGSKAAVRAAVWAADEAVDTDSTLLLLHVVD
jgi:nucleotide-binding universal stress UspA family protein